MRDHNKLRTFAMADQLAMDVYRYSQRVPQHEQFGLRSQMRRAAVSIAANLVEGCARSSEMEYARFVEIAYGSARELQYEVSLSSRLGYLQESAVNELHTSCCFDERASTPYFDR